MEWEMKYYINPQFGLIENWSGFGVTAQWDNNNIAAYITLTLMFLNFSASLNIGKRK